MENIISLDHHDIDQAIKQYIESQGINLTNKLFDIKFTQGRGANATNSANVHVSNAVEATEKKEVNTYNPVSATKSKDTKGKQTKDMSAKEAATTTCTDEVIVSTDEVDLDEDQPPITEESVVVEEEEPSDTTSLFGK